MNLQTERAIASILNGFTLKNLNPFLPKTLASYVCFIIIYSIGHPQSAYAILIQITLIFFGVAWFYKRL